MSGGTPIGFGGINGYVRQRYGQGYASSGEDMEDDVTSKPTRPSLSMLTIHRARTWREAVENLLWLGFAALIIYFGDCRKNLISILLWDKRINRAALYLGLVGLLLDLGLILYSTLFSHDTQKFSEKYEIPMRQSSMIQEKSEVFWKISPSVLLLGFLSFFLFLYALWPIWSFLSIPLLFTLLMTSIVISPYLLIGQANYQIFCALL
ncbi:uncharacterized protein [Typha angustifolia]|uniref:uncharacterized protein isoform X1 n=1 Tax=Typha angustifolia TaxID=59011 RepID=UPI003C2EEC1A